MSRKQVFSSDVHVSSRQKFGTKIVASDVCVPISGEEKRQERTKGMITSSLHSLLCFRSLSSRYQLRRKQ